jgi:hypothetical protein
MRLKGLLALGFLYIIGETMRKIPSSFILLFAIPAHALKN